MRNKKFWTSLIAGLMAALMLLGLIASVLPTRARAASSGEIREQINALEEQEAELQARIDELEGQISENLSEMEEIVAQKKIIDQEVTLLYAKIDNTNQQIGAYTVLIADKQDEYEEARDRFNALSEQNKERIRAMEEDGSLSYWSVLFKASSFSDLLDRLNMIQEIAASDQRRLNEMNEAANAVIEAQQALESEKETLEQTRAQLEVTRQELSDKQAEATALLDELRARGDEFERYMAEAELTVEELTIEIALKEAEYDEAVLAEWWATYVPPTTFPTEPPAQPDGSGDDGSSGGSSSGGSSSSGESSGGDYDNSNEGWLCPVPWYILTSPYGYRVHPIYGDTRFHSGVDLACSEGTPIYATRSGYVTSADYNWSMGNYVTIHHDEAYSSIYMHMIYSVVSSGQYVSQGQVIGYVGSTGDSTGPHLHFGIYCYGSTVNPMDYI